MPRQKDSELLWGAPCPWKNADWISCPIPLVVNVPPPTPTPPLSFAELQISSPLLPVSLPLTLRHPPFTHPSPILLSLQHPFPSSAAINPFLDKRKGREGKKEESVYLIIWATRPPAPSNHPPSTSRTFIFKERIDSGQRKQVQLEPRGKKKERIFFGCSIEEFAFPFIT